MPRLPVVLTLPASRGQTHTGSPAERRVLEPGAVEEKKNERHAKVHAMLAVVPKPPPEPMRSIPRVEASARSGFAQSTWGVVLAQEARSILRAPVSLTLESGARRVNLLGAVTPICEADAEYTWLLTVDGNVVASLVTTAVGLSMPLNFSEQLPPGEHEFDLQAFVGDTAGAPKATGSLTVIATT